MCDEILVSVEMPCTKFIGAGLGTCCLLFVWYEWLRRSRLKIFSLLESSGMGARCMSALRCRRLRMRECGMSFIGLEGV